MIDELEKQAGIISEWSGLDHQGILKMLRSSTIETDFSLTSKLNGLIKEEQKKADEKKKKHEEEAQALKIKKIQGALGTESDVIIDTSSNAASKEVETPTLPIVEETKIEELPEKKVELT